MIRQRSNKHILIVFFIVASAALANAGVALFNCSQASDNYTTRIKSEHHFEQASGPSLPNFINQFVELFESKEKIGEKNFKRDKETPQHGLAFDFSGIQLNKFKFGKKEYQSVSYQAKAFYILFQSLRICC